jgi:outer membrane protein assembly factor BamA
MNFQAEIFFREPHFINADNSLLSKIYLRELGSYQIPLAIERRFGFNGVITHKVKGNDKLTTNFGIGYENIHLREGDYNKIYNMYKMRNLDFSKRTNQLLGGNFINFAPSVEYKDIDDEFMPRDGLIAKAGFTESICVDHIKRTNGRLAASIKKYIPIFKKSTLSLTARGGIKVHGDQMPEVMSFALGGPYTIRGFRMSGVGTGDSFLMGSAELQTPIPFMDRFKYDVLKNLRFAFFIDAGKVFDPTISSKLFDRPNSAIVAGVGLRINIKGIGPISIDYGLPFTHVGQYNSKNGYFTFGTGGLYDSY